MVVRDKPSHRRLRSARTRKRRQHAPAPHRNENYDQGDGTRYRSLGCGPCQRPIQSKSKNVDDIITELKSGTLKNIAERSGRMQDGKHGLEELRRKGYM